MNTAEEEIALDTFEEEIIDEVPTLSTSGSDQDYAVLEFNQLKAINEEEATDEDPELIPKDDSFKEESLVLRFDKNAQEVLCDISDMAAEDSNIPVISITTTDDNVNEARINLNPYQASPEPLTDLEDLDHDQEQAFKGKLKIRQEDDGGLTDAEVMEASDDEKDTSYVPNIAIHLDDILDYGGTYEELVRVGSPKSRFRGNDNFESVSATKPDTGKGLLNTFYEKEGVTDYEDFDLSDEEDNVDEEGEEATEDDNFLERLNDDETVAISDTVRQSPVPSPSVTPEPGARPKKGKVSKKGKHSRKKATNQNLLSPRSISPHLSDVTDTEIVYSDSEEDVLKQRPLSPQERRRRQKLEDELRTKQKIIDPTGSYSSHVLPEHELSSVHISEKIPVAELPSESDTDNTYPTPRKQGIYAPRKKTLLMEVAGALMKETFASTDVEQFEGSIESDDDATSQVSDSHYSVVDSQSGSVKEKQLAKNRLGLPKQDRIVLTDTEDITDDETYRMDQAASPFLKKVDLDGDSTEEDDLETTDSEYVAAVRELRARAWKDSNYEIRFINVEGKTRPLAVTPDLPRTSASSLAPPQINLYATDTEDLDEDPIIDKPKSFLNIHSLEHDGGITDTEDMEGEEDMFRPKSPEMSDEEQSQALPEPTREMVLMKEDSSGRPVSVVLPLGNVEPGGLTTPRVELEGGISEVEDILTDDDDALTVPVLIACPTPDLSDIEGGIIHTSEVVKVQKKKLKVMSEGAPEPLTDTEDLFLSASGKRKRIKNKQRLGLEAKPNDIQQELTDTEDLVFSDAENRQKKHLSLPQIETDPVTDLDDVDASGEEDLIDAQWSTGITPEYLPEFEGDSYTTLKEGSGPFSEEARQHLLSLNIPSIKTISPSPDIHFINTDTEDMVASADEDGFSRAETMTPYGVAIELEDQSSFVYMKHTRKFDLDAPEEAMHVKGARDIHESHTDVEDISGVSEDERPKPPEQLFVNDTKNQVCVCLSSEVDEEDSVCVCVSKEHGGLSLVWNSKNSTDAKHHRGTRSIQLSSRKPSCRMVATHGYSQLPTVNTPYIINSSTIKSKLQKPRTSFSTSCNKYLLIEDHTDSNYSSFYLYIETLGNPSIVKVVFKMSISLTPLGFATKVVICQRNVFPSNIASLVVYIFKTVALNTETNKTQSVYLEISESTSISVVNTLPHARRQSKTRRKVQNRAWSGSDILEQKPDALEDTKPRSVSVSKLISRFECLSSVNNTEMGEEMSVSASNSNENSKSVFIITDETEGSSTPQITLYGENTYDDSDIENGNIQTASTLKKPDSSFKPIIPIVPLKDRSVSPRRLDPASIKDSPAFKALCKRARGAVETLAHPIHTKPTEDPKSFLITSYKMKKTFDFFTKMSLQKEFKNGSDLTGKIQKFETLSGSPRLRRKLTLKRHSETEIDTDSESLPSTKSTSYSDITRSFTTLTLSRKTISSNTIDNNGETASVRQGSSIRRTTSCPINQWVRKGNQPLMAYGAGP